MVDNLKLVLASPAYEAQIEAYKADSLQDDPEGIHGAAGLSRMSARQWLAALELRKREDTLPKGFVMDSNYLCFRQADQALVGIINIRHTLNDALMEHGGHIGYVIHPNYRGRGYGKEQLRLALALCPELGINKVLITCDEKNLASRATILANGGVYEDTRLDPDGLPTQRYWIDRTT